MASRMIIYYSGNACNSSEAEQIVKGLGGVMMTFCYVVDDTRKQGARFQALLNGREQSDNLLLRGTEGNRKRRT